MRKTIVTTIEPTLPAVNLEDVKDRLVVDLNDDDPSVEFWLATATKHAENFLNRRLMPQSVELKMDGFPSHGFEIGIDPVRSITSIKYDDSDNVEQTLASSVYESDLDRLKGWIQPKTGQVWPSTYDKLQSVRIAMDVGFASAAVIPQPIRHAIILMVGHYYENRENVAVGALKEIPQGAKAHLWPLRIVPV